LFDSPVGSLPDQALICNDPANTDPDTKEITLDANPSGGTDFEYQWYQGGVILVSEIDQELLVTEPGLYSVDIENSFGCVGSDQTEVVPECQPLIVAPTAFRPGSSNADNQVFFLIPVFVDDADFQLFIFNRWGEMVHQSNGVTREQHQWNGGYKNNASQPLPAGTYSYIVKYRSAYRPQDGVQEKRGGVVLLR
jgi:gliding motility-associated-like protein